MIGPLSYNLENEKTIIGIINVLKAYDICELP